MKKLSVAFLVLIILLFLGCASKTPADNYIIKDEPLKPLDLENAWYKKYEIKELDLLIKKALMQNYDIKNAYLNLAKAYANLGITTADSFFTINASHTSSITKTDHLTSKDYSFGIGLNYELDIFSKIQSSINSSKWSVKTSQKELQNTQLLLINNLVAAYFRGCFLAQKQELLTKNLSNYNELLNITSKKVQFGKAEALAINEVQNSILSLRSQLLSNQNDISKNTQTIKNLLGESSDSSSINTNIESMFDKGALVDGFLAKEYGDIKFAKLTTIKPTFSTLEKPLFYLSQRPDIKAIIARLNSSFYDYDVSKKAFFPSVSIAGSISSRASNLKDSFALDVLGGNIKINLGFLDYARVKNRVKVSRLEFERNLLAYQNGLINALNEIEFLDKSYEISKQLYKNSQKTLQTTKLISNSYRLKYDYGKVELKDYLSSNSNFINSELLLLNSKYDLLINEVGLYKAIGLKEIL